MFGSFSSKDDYETISMPAHKLQAQLGIDSDASPSIFHGINVASFGNSRRNPFFKLKAVAMDSKVSIEDRMMAVRYMIKIPHKDMRSNTIEAALSIVDEESVPIGERYFFMSNNEAEIKLTDPHIVRACHLHFFQKSKEGNYPLILRLLSAQFIYTSFAHNDAHWNDARLFILRLALDQQESVRIRSEAADILCKRICHTDASVGRDVIKELGGLYIQNKISTIYTNAQNAHDETINESVMEIVRNLVATRKKLDETEAPTGFSDLAEGKTALVKNTGEIYERIMRLTAADEEARREKIRGAFNFLLIYPARYEGLCLSDILVLVWERICLQPGEVKKELEKRLLEELYEMDQTCGTGLLTRVVNVLSGYIEEDKFQIRMNPLDQLRSNIFARLGVNLRLLGEKLQDEILAEIAEAGSPKRAAREFVESYGVAEELKEEFVQSGLISKEKFDQVYNKCIRDFLGIEEEKRPSKEEKKQDAKEVVKQENFDDFSEDPFEAIPMHKNKKCSGS